MILRVFNLFLDYAYYPFVKYRIHISLIFLFLLISLYQLSGDNNYSWPVILSFSLWHFALYLFDRAYDYKLDAINQPKEAILPKERKLILIISIVMAILPIGILAYFKLKILPYIVFIPITFLYTYPIYKGIRSKNILFFKNFYSAFFIWTLPLAFVSYFYISSEGNFWQVFYLQFTGLFIYVMIGEAFWDIRDVNGDKLQKVQTIPVVFGVKFAKVYLILLMLIDLFLFGKTVTDSAIIYLILILICSPKSPRWIFHIPPILALFRFIKPLLIQ